MSLSEEQLRRIEENKKRAQQKLSERKRQTPSVVNNIAPPAKKLAPEIPSRNTNEASKTSCPNFQTHKKSFNDFKSQQGSSNAINKPKYGGNKIKLDFTLVSKTRFEVVCPYQATIIEVFKQIPSRSYDAKRTIWSFGIEDHNNLVSSLKKQCSSSSSDYQLEMDCIPKVVVNMFTTSQRSSSGNEKAVELAGRVDDKLVKALMPFQREGVEFGIHHNGRVLIADDMGLGKTLQAICIAVYYQEAWPLLVLCPSSVRQMWAEAFEYWVPTLKEGSIKALYRLQDSFSNASIIIASYDTLSRASTIFSNKDFQLVIADESHFLKNHKTVRSKAAIPLIKKARYAILLSGTPALSRPVELYTQLSSLDRHFGMNLFEFGKRYCAAVKNAWGWDFSGASHLKELQLYMEACIMIRRLKSDVLDQLPEKRRQMVSLDPTITSDSHQFEEMRKKLDSVSRQKSKAQHSQLLQLYEETARMKLAGIKDYIIDKLEGGQQKLIVFAHHKIVLNNICDLLNQKKHQHIRIDGKTPPTIRQTLCDQFQHDKQYIAAVLSITTANAGLTLTAASTVIFAELFWNPGILVQAEDRAYRIGQKNSVNVQYLVARGTADDFIWPMIQRKLTILSQAGLAKEDFSGATNTVIRGKHEKDLMSYFESLSESEKPSVEDTVCDGALRTGVPRYQEKCATNKNSTLLNHFTVKRQNNHKPHATDHNSHSQNSNPHSSSDDPVLSQEEIDHLFTDGDLDSWFDDIT